MLKSNSDYWDSVSHDYNSLYCDQWSLAENKFVERLILKEVNSRNNFEVLDLGCGTGFVYDKLVDFGCKFKYTGLDISDGMLKIFKKKYSNDNLTLHHGCMSNLSILNNKKFDIIVSTFSSISFVEDMYRIIDSLNAYLLNGGVIILSFLNRFSLRRVGRFKFRKYEKYRTRNSHDEIYLDSWTYTRSDVLINTNSSKRMNFKFIGYNTLAGVYTNILFWKFNLFISKLFPSLSHEIILIIKYA